MSSLADLSKLAAELPTSSLSFQASGILAWSSPA
jgi:hypothetical protein